LRGELVAKALAWSRGRKSDDRKAKRTKSSGPIQKLTEALEGLVGKKKRKKKKERLREDGVIQSSRNSSGDTSQEETGQEDSSDTDLEAQIMPGAKWIRML